MWTSIDEDIHAMALQVGLREQGHAMGSRGRAVCQLEEERMRLERAVTPSLLPTAGSCSRRRSSAGAARGWESKASELAANRRRH